MQCKYLSVRSKDYNKYIYCRKNKEEITFGRCKNCKYKEYKEVKKIIKKSKKLAKLERQRDKNLKKEGICEYCGKYSKRLDPHEVYGGSNRKRSMKYKFVKLICPQCHGNEEIIMKLREDTQKQFEKNHTTEEFIAIVGKNYLEND